MPQPETAAIRNDEQASRIHDYESFPPPPVSAGEVNLSFTTSGDGLDIESQTVETANDADASENGRHGNASSVVENASQPKSKYGPPDPTLYTQFPAKSETYLRMALSVFLPFILAGIGMVIAGVVLDKVQHWDVFRSVDELFVMVPALLGLKGNLEMTSASRLSTAANMGKMNDRHSWWIMASGSISITQAQSIVVGLLAGLLAVPLSFLQEMSVAGFTWTKLLLLLSSGVITSSIASFLLDTMMITLVTVCHRYKVNPDNVALPIAASLGDFGTLVILSGIATALWNEVSTNFWILPTITAFPLLLLPFWLVSARRNSFVREVTADGWVPVISAMAISSVSGAIMKDIVANFEFVALYQPLMNGVGGNLAGILASKLSTRLHQLFEKPGSLIWRCLTEFCEPLPPSTQTAEEPPTVEELNGQSSAGVVGQGATQVDMQHSESGMNLPNHEELSREAESVNEEVSRSVAEALGSTSVSSHHSRAHRVSFPSSVKINGIDETEMNSCNASNPNMNSNDMEAVTNFDNPSVAIRHTTEQQNITSHFRRRLDSVDVRSVGIYLDPYDKGILLKRGCPNPIMTFCSGASVARTSQILIALLLPGVVTFLFIIYAIHPNLVYSAQFVLLYMAAALIHLVILLYFAHWIVQLFWRIGRDPDNFAVPFITAVGDVLGSLLIAAVFSLLRLMNDPMAIPRSGFNVSNVTDAVSWSVTFTSTTPLGPTQF